MELSEKTLTYIRGAFGSELKYRSGTINGEIVNTIFGMKQPNFSNNDIVNDVMARNNNKFSRGSVLAALSVMLRKERFSKFLESCKVPMPKGQKGGKAWMHRFNDTVIEDTRQNFKDQEDIIKTLNANQCVGKGKLLKIVYAGGRPQEHPKLFEVARDFQCDLRVVPCDSKTFNPNSADLIMVCTCNIGHSLQGKIESAKKGDVHMTWVNESSCRAFKDELLKYLNKYIPEWRDTLKLLCQQAKKFNRPTMKDVPRTKPAKRIEKKEAIVSSTSKECHIETILKECKSLIQMAIDDANEKLADLDINTGSLSVNQTEGKVAVGLGFSV